jgi:hypothetical protein
MPVSGHNPPPTHGLTHPRAFSGDGHQNLAQLEAIHMSIILGDGTCMELKKKHIKSIKWFCDLFSYLICLSTVYVVNIQFNEVLDP